MKSTQDNSQVQEPGGMKALYFGADPRGYCCCLEWCSHNARLSRSRLFYASGTSTTYGDLLEKIHLATVLGHLY